MRHLYRRVAAAVICGLTSLILLAPARAQYAQRRQVSKGPRATAIVQLQGKRARLVPVVIMINGQFYDASIYRADPRPMALDPGVVYEAVRDGSSVGLFTVGNALQLNNSWYGLGHWETDEEIQQAKQEQAKEEEQATAAKKAEAAAEDSGPPVLRRPGNEKPSAPNPPPPSTPPAQKPASAPPAAPPKQPTANAAPQPAPAAPSGSPDDYDPNRPVLRRGKPAVTSQEETWPAELAPGKPAASAAAGKAAPAQPKIEQLPAISDANGPELRSYDFSLSSGERNSDYQKMIGYAQDAVSKYERLRHPDFASSQLGASDFRYFDVDLSNEPVFVLSAPATVNFGAAPRRATRRRTAARSAQMNEPVPGKQEQAYVTVVAKVDLYGELKQIFSSVTDSTHLDEIPRLQLIDAVDVDGDSRGELLFQETTDSGTGYVIYRVYPDQLIQLFDTLGPQH